MPAGLTAAHTAVPKQGQPRHSQARVTAPGLTQPRGSTCQPVPAEMELKPKAKGGVSPSCTDTLTLDSEADRMMGAMIWG